MVYHESPTFNAIPVDPFPIDYPKSVTSVNLKDAGVPAGTYWVCVSAYNTTPPVPDGTATYSAYQQVTVTE